MKPAKWLNIFIAVLIFVPALTMTVTAWLDPFFHYHGPLPSFYYELSNERSQNDGIVKRFDYDALITGTSITQNFRASEMSAWFDCHAIKVSFSGATFKELANILDTAFASRDIRYVVCCTFDVSNSYIQDKDYLQEAFDYPTYLYNNNPFDDVAYLLNRDVLVQYVAPMLARRIAGVPGGYTSFDDYSNTMALRNTYGIAAFGDMSGFVNRMEQHSLSEADKETIRDNLEQNVLRIARAHPETTFYYFVPPVSIARWGRDYSDGEALRKIEAEEMAIAMFLSCDNIRLFSFSLDEAIVCDPDNYNDATHYGDWINSLMLRAMADDDTRYRITHENADRYVEDLKRLYLEYDYESLKEPR